ncbi:MAG: hypothetical protein L7W43_20425, partial [Rubripirellula sp.]|nr:hypothetical protein [Rubripirellula sp.]
MKRYIPLLLCSFFVVSCLSIAKADNNGCIAKKLSTIPIVKRAFGPTRNQLISQNQGLNEHIKGLNQQLEKLQLALAEAEAVSAKQAADIKGLTQSLAAAQAAGEKADAARKKTEQALAAANAGKKQAQA